MMIGVCIGKVDFSFSFSFSVPTFFPVGIPGASDKHPEDHLPRSLFRHGFCFKNPKKGRDRD